MRTYLISTRKTFSEYISHLTVLKTFCSKDIDKIGRRRHFTVALAHTRTHAFTHASANTHIHTHNAYIRYRLYILSRMLWCLDLVQYLSRAFVDSTAKIYYNVFMWTSCITHCTQARARTHIHRNITRNLWNNIMYARTYKVTHTLLFQR